MNIDEAIEILEEYGSSDDPISFQGTETTPQDLGYRLNGNLPASTIRVAYYNNRAHRWVHGSLSGMVKDRKIQTPIKVLKPKDDNWYRIYHTVQKLFWDSSKWTKDGKVYFSQDSIDRAFRNTNGYLWNQDRKLIQVIKYKVHAQN